MYPHQHFLLMAEEPVARHLLLDVHPLSAELVFVYLGALAYDGDQLFYAQAHCPDCGDVGSGSIRLGACAACPGSGTVLAMDQHLDEVRLARASMNAARVAADNAAASYRSSVRSAVTAWKADGLSLRKSAERLGITEGALRDLLRPDGVTRRARVSKKTDPTKEAAHAENEDPAEVAGEVYAADRTA